MHNQTSDTHHGSTAVVQLDRSLAKLGLLVKLVPSKVQVTVTVVTRELGQSKGVTVDNLGNQRRGNHLDDNDLVRGGERLETSGHALGAGEADSGGSHKVTDNSKHADAAVLDLNLAEAVETGFIGVLQQSQGIKETKLRKEQDKTRT